MRSTALIPIVSLLFGACNNSSETSSDRLSAKAIDSPRHNVAASPNRAAELADTISYSSDSLQYLALDSFELVTYELATDTLKLVSTSNFLYYPFGSFSSVSALKKAGLKFAFQQESDASDTSVQIYRATFANSFVKLFQDDEKKKLEIVSGRILNKEIKLINGIRIGTSKRSFFSSFFKKPSTIEKTDHKVIELISGLDGIRHYYAFKNSVITSIKFDSDYQFNKL